MRRPSMHVCAFVVVGVLLLGAPLASAQSQCVYADERGNILSAHSLKDVPSRFRSKAACKDSQPVSIPKADEVALRGGVRSSSFGTPLGTMDVRWPRQVEQCFGKSPSRAISEAASAVNRALRSGRFDEKMKYARRDWSLVLIDRASAVSQFPMQLSLGGHPGFMVPPNQIYIVVDFISPNCKPSGDVDALLTQVLLHEMGHVLEFSLLGEDGFAGDRKRAEGFAAWFEGYSSKFSAAIPRGRVQETYRGMVQSETSVGSQQFSGSGQDYAVASLEFDAIVARKGISGLMDVYETMSDCRCSFYEALHKKFGWDQKDLQREVKSLNPS